MFLFSDLSFQFTLIYTSVVSVLAHWDVREWTVVTSDRRSLSAFCAPDDVGYLT